MILTHFGKINFRLLDLRRKLLLPRAIREGDNFLVRGANWLIIHSSPSSKAAFLKNILVQRFPNYKFSFSKFPELLDSSNDSNEILVGAIMELKTFSIERLKDYDRVLKKFKHIPVILILTPSTYQILMSHRRSVIDQSLVILSDLKSLDYVIQLPRFIEEVGKKRRLKMQNERLQKLLEKTLPRHDDFIPKSQNEVPEPRMVKQILMVDREVHQGQQCALKICLKNWKKIRSTIGQSARLEVLDLVSRLINNSVRNSDRVLHSDEHEFLVLLANTKAVHLKTCMERLEAALKGLSLTANNRVLKPSFSILTLEGFALNA